MSSAPRADGRRSDQLRTITFEPNIAPYATGSVLVSFGLTRVICGATIEANVPTWMKQQKVPGGWLTAEYSMLPYSTLDRKQRDISRGKIDGRTVEIQRLIGRSLRAVIDLQKLGQNTLWLDCDVLQADGGTRTAAITGGYVALADACDALVARRAIAASPLHGQVAAVSVGICKGTPVIDLDYAEDSGAETDMNVVMNNGGGFIEVQGTAEGHAFRRHELDALLNLAASGIARLFQLQQEVRTTA
jgi:ribonuclease PH